jgi:hypothetical protein
MTLHLFLGICLWIELAALALIFVAVGTAADKAESGS